MAVIHGINDELAPKPKVKRLFSLFPYGVLLESLNCPSSAIFTEEFNGLVLAIQRFLAFLGEERYTSSFLKRKTVCPHGAFSPMRILEEAEMVSGASGWANAALMAGFANEFALSLMEKSDVEQFGLSPDDVEKVMKLVNDLKRI